MKWTVYQNEQLKVLLTFSKKMTAGIRRLAQNTYYPS